MHVQVRLIADLALASNSCVAAVPSVSPEPKPLHMCSSMYMIRAGSTPKHMAEESAWPELVKREDGLQSHKHDACKAQADEEQ